MDEQTTWRGHGFTLFVFAGIVSLCAIFFILGMLVGRNQGLKSAANGAESKKTSASADKPDDKLDFSEELQKNTLPPLIVDPPPTAGVTPEESTPPEPTAKESDPPSPSPPPPPPSPTTPPPPTTSPNTPVTFQVGAFAQSSQASKLVAELKKIGFDRPTIVPPASGENPPRYRVQVGPYKNAGDAASAKKKIEAAGYQVMVKK